MLEETIAVTLAYLAVVILLMAPAQRTHSSKAPQGGRVAQSLCLKQLTIRELKQRARRAKIRGYGSMRKVELLQHLLASPE